MVKIIQAGERDDRGATEHWPSEKQSTWEQRTYWRFLISEDD